GRSGCGAAVWLAGYRGAGQSPHQPSGSFLSYLPSPTPWSLPSVRLPPHRGHPTHFRETHALYRHDSSRRRRWTQVATALGARSKPSAVAPRFSRSTRRLASRASFLANTLSSYACWVVTR